MIQRLELQNWRAYDRLDLEFGPGATFVVASNGIGKTSLIMAAAWGIFGDIAGVKGADEIRVWRVGEAIHANIPRSVVKEPPVIDHRPGAHAPVPEKGRTARRRSWTPIAACTERSTASGLDWMSSVQW